MKSLEQDRWVCHCLGSGLFDEEGRQIQVEDSNWKAQELLILTIPVRDVAGQQVGWLLQEEPQKDLVECSPRRS